MNKVAIIFGTRPEAIKMAPIILAMKGDPRFRADVCVTGQHRQMLDQVLQTFDITPDYDLAVMTHNQGLASLTGKLLESLSIYLQVNQPELVLVQGDTTTVMCATLAAFYLKIPVGHVEAGLRSGDIYSPWPEEANRTIVSRIARLHFAPTLQSASNLQREGIPAEQVYVTGNTVVDALQLVRLRLKNRPVSIPKLDAILALNPEPDIVLITGHRRENFGVGFESICRAIRELAGRFPNVHFVYPVHLNPNVRNPVEKILGGQEITNIHLLEPLGYLPFVSLMERAKLILSDSGGIQEEAPSLGKPVLVMRNTTERPEGVDAGMVKLVGARFETIVKETSELLSDEVAYTRMTQGENPYGDGRAAKKIIAICHDFFTARPGMDSLPKVA
ncbi:MAG: non-hydrolyzing UDP-N-acetylglucosamine 2-epimerase [Gemmataceae bacterium]